MHSVQDRHTLQWWRHNVERPGGVWHLWAVPGRDRCKPIEVFFFFFVNWAMILGTVVHKLHQSSCRQAVTLATYPVTCCLSFPWTAPGKLLQDLLGTKLCVCRNLTSVGAHSVLLGSVGRGPRTNGADTSLSLP